MELNTTMDAVVGVFVDAVVEEHTLVVDTDVANNAEAVNTATHTGTMPIPAMSMKLTA